MREIVGNIVAIRPQYDYKTGEEKKGKGTFVTIGIMRDAGNGKLVGRIDAIPNWKEWDGTVWIFPPKIHENRNAQSSAPMGGALDNNDEDASF